MRIKKLAILFCAAAMVAGVISGCGNSKNDTETTTKPTDSDTENSQEETTMADEDSSVDAATTDFEAVDVSTAGWNITVENILANAEMSNVSVTLGYEDSQTNTVKYTADEGYKYVVIKMLIEKDTSTENIEWEKMLLKDSAGTEYSRIEDTFLEELGMERMAGTTLNFGTNEGWIAYMVPETETDFTLIYAFENDNIDYNFNVE